MQEREFFGKVGIARVAQFGKLFLGELLGAYQNLPDLAHDRLQEFQIALLAGNHALPVPLIDISGVVVVEKIILADGAHIGADSLPRTAPELLQGYSFPFRGSL